MVERDETLYWRKSSFSCTGDCVEWAPSADGGVLVRDSKDPQGARLSFTGSEWMAFLSAVRNGEADMPRG